MIVLRGSLLPKFILGYCSFRSNGWTFSSENAPKLILTVHLMDRKEHPRVSYCRANPAYGQWDNYRTNYDDFLAVYLFGIQVGVVYLRGFKAIRRISETM
jgi:hypothetical protein